MATSEELRAEISTVERGKTIVIVGSIVLLTLATALKYVEIPGIDERFAALVVDVATALGGALFGITIGSIWWGKITERETKRGLVDAVAGMFTSDPKMVAEYFDNDAILGFVGKNVEARTGDPLLARAITSDLIAPFVAGRGATRKVRTEQEYAVRLRYDDGGTSGGKGFATWEVVENLSFQERLPITVRDGSVLAAFVFCESALSGYFAREDCMYRTIAYMPQAVRLGGVDARAEWVAQNIDCKIRMGGEGLQLRPRVQVEGDEAAWVVEYILDSASAAVIDELIASTSEMAVHRGEVAALRIVIQSRATYSPARHNFTAYLAYPTLNPKIEFAIDGPVDRLECATFYSRAVNPHGGLSGDDVTVTAKDLVEPLEKSRNLQITLTSSRWVFPMSGASFSWTREDTGAE